MNRTRLSEQRIATAVAWTATAIIATTAALSAFAAAPEQKTPQARYESEKAACLNDRSPQDRETCLREAAAALQQARSGALATGATTSDHQANRVARCELQPAADRDECVRRVSGDGKRSGSVAGGGVEYELTTRKVGTPTILIPLAPAQAGSAVR